MFGHYFSLAITSIWIVILPGKTILATSHETVAGLYSLTIPAIESMYFRVWVDSICIQVWFLKGLKGPGCRHSRQEFLTHVKQCLLPQVNLSMVDYCADQTLDRSTPTTSKTYLWRSQQRWSILFIYGTTRGRGFNRHPSRTDQSKKLGEISGRRKLRSTIRGTLSVYDPR